MEPMDAAGRIILLVAATRGGSGSGDGATDDGSAARRCLVSGIPHAEATNIFQVSVVIGVIVVVVVVVVIVVVVVVVVVVIVMVKLIVASSRDGDGSTDHGSATRGAATLGIVAHTVPAPLTNELTAAGIERKGRMVRLMQRRPHRARADLRISHRFSGLKGGRRGGGGPALSTGSATGRCPRHFSRRSCSSGAMEHKIKIERWRRV
jgi:hypothetical protein